LAPQAGCTAAAPPAGAAEAGAAPRGRSQRERAHTAHRTPAQRTPHSTAQPGLAAKARGLCVVCFFFLETVCRGRNASITSCAWNVPTAGRECGQQRFGHRHATLGRAAVHQAAAPRPRQKIQQELVQQATPPPARRAVGGWVHLGLSHLSKLGRPHRRPAASRRAGCGVQRRRRTPSAPACAAEYLARADSAVHSTRCRALRALATPHVTCGRTEQGHWCTSQGRGGLIS
jgi:hypothetical protein